MKQIIPPNYLEAIPCIITAVLCATMTLNIKPPDKLPEMRSNGYTRLDEGNRYIRKHLPIQQRYEYRRGQRPLLKDIHIDKKAIVCVKGHYLFVDNEEYYSFFNNENDEVISMWIIKES